MKAMRSLGWEEAAWFSRRMLTGILEVVLVMRWLGPLARSINHAWGWNGKALRLCDAQLL